MLRVWFKIVWALGKNCRFALAFRERSGECLPEITDLRPVGQISNASVVFLKKKVMRANDKS